MWLPSRALSAITKRALMHLIYQFYWFIYIYVIGIFFPYLKTFVFPANAPEADSVYRAEISL